MSDPKSYTAASTLPAKLLQDAELIQRIRAGYIPPVHVQINPTNRCNLNCDFCSCSERDKKLEISVGKMMVACLVFKKLGCKSATITGGGEPLLYPAINNLIRALNRYLNIKVGLVTNGTQFAKLEAYNDITWCRISSSDDREPDWGGIKRAVQNAPEIDWAFSHVVTRNPNFKIIGPLVDFANQQGFTHVRLVADLLDIEATAPKMADVKHFLSVQGINDSKVIYQDRADYVRGRKRCLISLLKPVIGADGGIYPCCGVQYAQVEPGRDYVEEMRMGFVNEMEDIWKNQGYFDGSKCARCYYDPYNVALELISTPLTHKEFL